MKIPEYEPRVSLPSPGPAPTISADAAAAPYAAIAGVGKEIQDLEHTIQEKQDEVFRVKDITNRSLQAESDIGDLMIALGKERDPQTAPQKFTDGIAEIRDRAMDGVGDYKVANALTTHLANREIAGSAQVKHEAFRWTLENDQEDMMAQNDRWKKAAVNNPNQVDYAAGKIIERIAASVATGSIKPETGRILAEKERKDLYVQVMSRMMLTDPKNAPDAIKPLLIKSGLDPNDIWAMEQRAEHARTSFEAKMLRGDKVVWETNAAQASIAIRSGSLNENGVNEMFATGKIGPDQLTHLQAVLDSTKTRSTSDNNQTSMRAMYDALNGVFFGSRRPEIVLREINGNANILPEHKAHAAQTLLSIGKAGSSIPSQMEKAMQLYRTTIAPSSFSLNPKQEEMDALGSTMREVWTDYFANEKKYQADPDLLIKRAIEKTKPENGASTIPASPYLDPAKLLKAFDYYVVKKNVNPNGATPRAYWQEWFNRAGLTMPPWPK